MPKFGFLGSIMVFSLQRPLLSHYLGLRVSLCPSAGDTRPPVPLYSGVGALGISGAQEGGRLHWPLLGNQTVPASAWTPAPGSVSCHLLEF